jgi:hypothetical protein
MRQQVQDRRRGISALTLYDIDTFDGVLKGCFSTRPAPALQAALMTMGKGGR